MPARVSRNLTPMRRSIIVLSLVSLCLSASAQEYYKKAHDDPDAVLKGHVAVEFYGVDVGFSNIDGAMLFVIGANGEYKVNDRISAEGSVRLPLVRFGSEGTGFVFDGGVYLRLNSVNAEKKVNVILGYKEEDIFGTNKRLATTKYVPITGTVKRIMILRGGVYLRNSGFGYDDGLLIDYKPASIFHKGVYIGIGKQRQYFFQLERTLNGKTAKFGAGSIFRPYVDVMILPTTVKLTQETFGLGEGPSKELSGLFGARAGFRWYRNPFWREQNEGRRIPFFGNTVVTLEAGMRPLEGLFVNGAISFIVHKF